MNPQPLTTRGYWDAGYDRTGRGVVTDLADFRQFAERRIVESVEALGLDGRRILEVGAGDSTILCHLARRLAGRAEFAGLDYSAPGCRLLAERAAGQGVEVNVLHGDVFEPAAAWVGAFDVVFSLGVVEHFPDLAEVVRAKGRLLAPSGRLFTLVPNLRGVLGVLARRYNRDVYNLHVAHDLASLQRGHEAGGLTVERAFHLCSNNFGVLSACFQRADTPGFLTYKYLSRVTKALWFLESRVGQLPALAALSPYLVVIARKDGT